MTRKFLVLITSLLSIGLLLAGCKSEDANTADTTDVETPADYPAEMTLFETDDGILTMIYPEGWATDQVQMETGIAFGIVPLAENFEQNPGTFFTDQVVMVYGFTQQVEADLAVADNLEGFHASTFYTDSASFEFALVAEPVVDTSVPGVTMIVTQAESTLSSGIHTNWMLATALADQTVIAFAVGLPDSAMQQYGQMAMDMFNSVTIDIISTGDLVK